MHSATPTAAAVAHTTLVRALLFPGALRRAISCIAASSKNELGTMKGPRKSGDPSPRQHDGADGDAKPDGNATERMRRALAAVAAGDGSTDELQAAARALVTDLRGHDAPPEKMLIKIKEILGSAGLRAGLAESDEAVSDHEAAVYRDVIMWSIRAYYEGR
jgi:hypothetical protein